MTARKVRPVVFQVGMRVRIVGYWKGGPTKDDVGREGVVVQVHRVRVSVRVGERAIDSQPACLMRLDKTILSEELYRLAFSNSPRLPSAVVVDGRRKEWVGIGWCDIGEPQSGDTWVVDQ